MSPIRLLRPPPTGALEVVADQVAGADIRVPVRAPAPAVPVPVLEAGVKPRK